MTEISSTMDYTYVPICGCAACAAATSDSETSPTYDEQSATGTGYSYAGFFFSDTTLESAVDSVFSGNRWVNTSLTFSFPNSVSDYGGASYYDQAALNGFAAMNANQKEAIRYIYDMIESFSQLTFTELTGSNDANADLMHAHSSDPSTAYAYYPSSNTVGGDAFYGASVPTGNDPLIGSYQFHTIMHEMGHTLGLKHGHQTGGGGVTPSEYAGQEYSIMTYLSHADSSATGYTIYSGSYPQSLMMLDIAAIQQMYGANFNANSANTTYTFSTTTGAMYINGVDMAAGANVDKTGNIIFRTIWDGNGTDTYDFSNFTRHLKIDLRPGEYSDLDVGGNAQRAQLDWANGGVYAQGHVYNALQYNDDARSLIENANGGTGDDSLYGNAANNILHGNAGSDTFYGSSGSDSLYGDEGSDLAIYSYDIADFLVYLVDSVTLTLQHILEGWIDTIVEIENFVFNNVAMTFSEVMALDASDQPDITTRFDWSGHSYRYVSDSVSTQVLTAEDMNYDGASGNVARFERDASGLLITLLSASAPATMSVGGSAENDVIRITGSNTNMSLKLYGNDGDDTLTVGGISGSVVLYGMDGNDTLNGGLGDDILYGDKVKSSDLWIGDDIIHGYGGNDMIYGHGGNDTLYGDDGDDQIWGQEGADNIYGGTGSDILWGGEGDDVIYGGEDDDTLYGETGSDTLNGGNGHDRLFGGDGDDIIYGGAGDDILYGDKVKSSDTASGDDVLYGEDGNDTLIGHSGNDLLYGGDGADKLYGGEDNDRLEGGAGSDTLYGEEGDDLIIGGADKDYLYGGAGNDVFGFESLDGSVDVIMDFTLNGAQQDSLNITNLLSGFTQGVSDINDFVHMNYRDANRVDLRINADGSGNDWAQIAIIRGSDFAGTSVDDLLATGQLILNQPL